MARAGDPGDPDDIRAEIAEKRRAVRPGDIAAEVEYANACENAWLHGIVAR